MSQKLFAEWFWVDRWMGSSAFGLPLDARGLYREMLSQAWLRGAKLPNDHDQIRRFVGVTRGEWNKTWKHVQHFWQVDGDWLVNETQAAVYAEAHARVERASRRGQAGAQARHKQNLSNARALASVSVSDQKNNKLVSTNEEVSDAVASLSFAKELGTKAAMAAAIRRPYQRVSRAK